MRKVIPHTHKSGFTLIESVVSLFIFVLLALAVYQTSFVIIRQINTYRENTTVSGLADQYLEIARNLPYSQIGTMTGNPHGNLPDLPNLKTVNFNGSTYQLYYVVNYIDDPADGTILLGTDFAPNDYKQIKLYVKNTTTGLTSSFLSTISPKGLEGLSSGGALSIKVFDAVGQPIPNASIHITNNILSPRIDLLRTSDADGNWIEVGLPNSANGYHIEVTKSGYSSDSTHAISATNPDPTKPDATITNGSVTLVSFSIDKLSTLTFNTYNQTCSGISGVNVNVQGSKLIGTPDLVKFNNSYTSNGSGLITLNNIEWDNYTPLLTTSSYMTYGSSPIQQINLLPNSNQQFTLILGPKTTHSLLVIVKDASTGNPLEGAQVELTKTLPALSAVKYTGGSIWSQEDWSGGAGQADFTDATKYATDDGGISTAEVPAGVRLNKLGSTYLSAGSFTSSTFDTGTASSSFTTLTWQPTSQDPATALKFQVATNNDNATWNYVGPDGATTTYYTVPGTTIFSGNNNNRYVRYRAYFETTDTTKTPVLTSNTLNYVSGCFTPGQVMFPGLTNDNDYSVTITMAGYPVKIIPNLTIGGYNVLSVSLSR